MSVTAEATVGTACAAGAVPGAVDVVTSGGGAGALAASGNLARLAPVKIGWWLVLGPMIGLLINWGNGNLCGFYLMFYWKTCSKILASKLFKFYYTFKVGH